MKQNLIYKILHLFTLLLTVQIAVAAPKEVVADSVQTAISQTLTRIVKRELKGVPVGVNSVVVKGNKVVIDASKNMSLDDVLLLCTSTDMMFSPLLNKDGFNVILPLSGLPDA